MNRISILGFAVFAMLISACGQKVDTPTSVPKPSWPPQSSLFFDALEKNLRSSEVQALLNSIPAEPQREEDSKWTDQKKLFYNFPKQGISLAFKLPEETLSGIYLYSEGTRGFRQYQGSLPYGLTFESQTFNLRNEPLPLFEQLFGKESYFRFTKPSENEYKMIYYNPEKRLSLIHNVVIIPPREKTINGFEVTGHYCPRNLDCVVIGRHLNEEDMQKIYTD